MKKTINSVPNMMNLEQIIIRYQVNIIKVHNSYKMITSGMTFLILKGFLYILLGITTLIERTLTRVTGVDELTFRQNLERGELNSGKNLSPKFKFIILLQTITFNNQYIIEPKQESV